MSFFKTIWKSNNKHHKLSEELALQKDTESETEQNEPNDATADIITFKLKYLGSTVVESGAAPHQIADNNNSDAIKNIIKVAKAGRKKLQSVNVSISLKGIAVTDLDGNDQFKISIYRISNCSTDSTHGQVFSFISTNADETKECHAFICPKRKTAETVTLAVAHAFNTAFQAWQVMPENQPKFCNNLSESIAKSNTSHDLLTSEETLIDFGGSSDQLSQPLFDEFDFGDKKAANFSTTSHWVNFDDDFGRSDLIMA